MASLDLDAVVAQVPRALEVAAEVRRAIVEKHGPAIVAHYNASSSLRSLVQETHNNRPAYMKRAMANAAARAKSAGSVDTSRFLTIVREEIRRAYARAEPKAGPRKAENLIRKTNTRRL